MAPRYNNTHYVPESKMKLLLSLALLVASIIVGVPQAQAVNVCVDGVPCLKPYSAGTAAKVS